CRLIDRPLRPSFKKGLRNEIQVVATLMALHPPPPYDGGALQTPAPTPPPAPFRHSQGEAMPQQQPTPPARRNVRREAPCV
ncbi:hypothetical protein ACFV3F_35610, partial [Streptomyces sp. NPDC059717]|uniref:hypothetical protein n=1 Tax=Streptomyces sp. NPDC059717 TaxID=3346922 RepID=UPI0036B2A3A2